MAKRRGYIVLLPILILLLAGCFRQASEPLDTVDSSTSNVTNPTTVPDVQPTDVQPTVEEQQDQPTTLPDVQPTEASNVQVSPSETPLVVMITSTPAFVQPSSTPVPTVGDTSDGGSVQPVPMVSPSPTTAQGLITPGAQQSNAVITPTASVNLVATATVALIETPTDMPIEDESEVDDECVYEVKSGDTLYRIAVNNGTTVEDIQAVNPTINPEIIRPGDEIVIPDCDSEPDVADDGDSTDGSTITVPGTDDTGDAGPVTIHEVVSGETLGEIARLYGVTINAVVEANNLTNPDRLSVGQELIIPPVEN